MRAEGIPRKINLIAERALLGVYAENGSSADKRQIGLAAREVFGIDLQRSRSRLPQRLAIGSSGLLIVVLLLWWLLPPVDTSPPISNFPQAPALSVSATDNRDVLPAAVIATSSSSAADSLAQENVLSQPDAVISRNVYESLLDRWNISQAANSIETLCILAAQNFLQCVESSDFSLNEIRRINRPLLLFLVNQESPVAILQEDDLQTLAGMPPVTSLVYLWKPPIGFSGLIFEGDRNSTVMNWLIPQLADIPSALGVTGTGGYFTRPLADALAKFQLQQGLKSDGVLGPVTIMLLNEVAGVSPTLTSGLVAD